MNSLEILSKSIMHKNIQTFVQLLTDNIVVIREGDDFGFYYDDDLIEYSFIHEKLDYCFYEYFQLRAENYNLDISSLNIFIISLLHEIGHYYTYDEEITEKYILSRMSYYFECSATQDIEKKKEIFNEYFNLPDEISATDWAICFIRDNFDFCKKWNNIFIGKKGK